MESSVPAFMARARRPGCDHPEEHAVYIGRHRGAAGSAPRSRSVPQDDALTGDEIAAGIGEPVGTGAENLAVEVLVERLREADRVLFFAAPIESQLARSATVTESSSPGGS